MTKWNTKKWVLASVGIGTVFICLYAGMYIYLRLSGEIISVREETSTRSYHNVMISTPDLRPVMANPEIDDQEFDRIYEQAGRQHRIMVFMWTPAIMLEEIVVNLFLAL